MRWRGARGLPGADGDSGADGADGGDADGDTSSMTKDEKSVWIFYTVAPTEPVKDAGKTKEGKTKEGKNNKEKFSTSTGQA
jgi:hypothetical protein